MKQCAPKNLSFITQLAVFLVIYVLLRCYFFTINHAALDQLDASAFYPAWILGLRFDLSALFTIFSGFFILAFVCDLNPNAAKVKNALWQISFVVQALFVFLNVIDCHLYAFIGRRTTFDSFAIAQDIRDQAVKIFFQYWHISFLVLFFTALLWVSTAYLARWTPLKRKLSLKYLVASFLALTAMSVLTIRSGFKYKPLSPTDALVLQPHALSAFALNSTFTLLKTPQDAILQPVDDLPPAEVKQILQDQTELPKFPTTQNTNVVIFIIESLASEYVGFLNPYPAYTPFLDTLAKESLIFENSFANGRRSVDATTSIISSIPSFVEIPIITSPYGQWIQNSLPQVLKKNKYESFFFHGARNGSMHFDVFSQITGFDHYLGLSEYPKNVEDFDGSWGIYDGPFFQYVKNTLTTRKSKAPFFATVFSLSSHNPFKLPNGIDFPEGTLQIHRTIRYVDDSLKAFFAQAALEPWYENTLFVITGDHTSLSDKPQYQNDYDRFRVPILFFHPRVKKFNRFSVGQKISIPIQHTDIASSVLNFLNIRTNPVNLFGSSIFSNSLQKSIYNQEYGVWWSFDGKQMIRKTGNQEPVAVTYGNSIGDFQLNRKKIIAFRQYAINGALYDTWYGPSAGF